MTTGMDASAGEVLASVSAAMAACVDDDGMVGRLRRHFPLVMTGRYRKISYEIMVLYRRVHGMYKSSRIFKQILIFT